MGWRRQRGQAPVRNLLMNFFATTDDVGVWRTFCSSGVIYFIAMTLSAFGYRLPPTEHPANVASGQAGRSCR